MEVEKQVCTFEQAKRFKELGIVQQSVFYFFSLPATSSHTLYCYIEKEDVPGQASDKGVARHGHPIQSTLRNRFAYSAFTVTELSRAISVLVTAPAFNEVIEKLSQEREANRDKKTIGSDVYVWQTMFDPVFLSDLLIRVLEAVPKRMIDEVNKALTK